MANRELCMLADTYVRSKHRSAGMYLSEKLDGMRALWLPATRGRPVKEIPFANMEKDLRNHVATGLWSRYGKPIFAPEWFLVGWPDYPLDGELYIGRGQFQGLMSAVKKHEPISAEWEQVAFHVFDAPLYTTIFADGKINNPQFKKQMRLLDNMGALGIPGDPREQGMFDIVYRTLQRDLALTRTLKLHPQRMLPFSTTEAQDWIDAELDRVTDAGGEGLMLRHPASQWEPVRSRFLLKIKKLHDAEGVVVGYRAGQGKYLGMLGSLSIRWEHAAFELSGFTDAERELTDKAKLDAVYYPGMVLGAGSSMVFADNEIVTFRYRELTEDGAPREARFLRKAVT